MKGYTNASSQGGGVLPSGKINITSTSETDVTNYATAQVVDANLVAGNIKQGTTILGITGSYTSDADASAANILNGYTAYVNGSKITGSMQSKSAQTYTPTTTDQTISSGQYLGGAQTIKGDTNLVAGNIKKDVQLFGITGTYEGSGGGGTSVWEEVDLGGSYPQWDIWAVLDQSGNTMHAEVSITIAGTTYINDSDDDIRYIHFKNVPYNTQISWSGTGDDVYWSWCKLDHYDSTSSNSGRGSSSTTTRVAQYTYNYKGTLMLTVASPET